MKNIMGGLMALQDEQVKSGSHLAFHGHEGVVERLYLQGFSLRQYDKGLAYIPNGALLENTMTVRTKELDRRCVVKIHVSHATKTATLRVFIQELDRILVRVFTEQHDQKRGKAVNVLGLDKRRRSHWDNILKKTDQTQLLSVSEEEESELQRRFWISIERAFVIHVTYYSQERHMKQLMAEKTEVRDLLRRHDRPHPVTNSKSLVITADRAGGHRAAREAPH
jgi:small-conductance mechanosensitive channel